MTTNTSTTGRHPLYRKLSQAQISAIRLLVIGGGQARSGTRPLTAATVTGLRNLGVTEPAPGDPNRDRFAYLFAANDPVPAEQLTSTGWALVNAHRPVFDILNRSPRTGHLERPSTAPTAPTQPSP